MSKLEQYLGLTKDEQALFDRLFKLVDDQQSGFASGKQVSNLFVTSRLPRKTLATIWNISCQGNQSGKLDRDGFFVGCRLVALAQQNIPVSQQALRAHRDLPLPMFYGPAQQYYPRQSRGRSPSASGTVAPSHSPVPPPILQHQKSLPVQQTAPIQQQQGVPMLGNPPDTTWEMTEDQRQTYLKYFAKADKDNDGFLNGREAQAFFTMSKLSSAALRDIWLMSDIDQDNKLNRDEFVTAMHLIMTVRLSGSPLPKQLPMCLRPYAARAQHPVSEVPVPDLLGPMPISSAPLANTSDSGAASTAGAAPSLDVLSGLVGTLVVSGPSPEEQERRLEQERQIASVNDEIESHRSAVHDLKTKLSGLESEQEPLAEQLKEREDALAKAAAERKEIHRLCEGVRDQVRLQKDRVLELESRIESEHEASKDYDRRLAEARLLLEALTQQRDSRTAKVEKLKQEVQDKELAMVCLDQSIADMRTQIEQIEDAFSYEEQVMARHTLAHESKEAEEKRLKDKLSRAKTDLEVMQATSPASREPSSSSDRPSQAGLSSVDPRVVQATVLPATAGDAQLDWPVSAATGDDDIAEFTFPELSPDEFGAASPSVSPYNSTGLAAPHSHASTLSPQSPEGGPAPSTDSFFDSANDLEFPMVDDAAWDTFSTSPAPDATAAAAAAASELSSHLDANPFDSVGDAEWGGIDVSVQKHAGEDAAAAPFKTAVPPDNEWPSFEADGDGAANTWAEF